MCVGPMPGFLPKIRNESDHKLGNSLLFHRSDINKNLSIIRFACVEKLNYLCFGFS
jgi:hypothetical protein